MKKTLALILVMLSIFLVSCGNISLSDYSITDKIVADDNSTYSFVKGETSTPAEYSTYSQNAQYFTFNVLSNLYDEENVTFSSGSLFASLCLLENATDSHTKTEIKNLVNPDVSLDTINICNGYFLSRIKELSMANNSNLTIDNSFFFNKDLVVSSDFLKVNANFYKKNLYQFDFTDTKATELVADNFNFSADFLSFSEKASINCVSLSTITSSWSDPYYTENIFEDVFYGTKGNSNAKYMSSVEYYLQGKNCTGFIKNFYDTPCKFVALIPDEDVSIKEFTSRLTAQKYNDILDSFNVFTTCNAYLPQFSLTQETNFSDVLSKTGVCALFTQDGNLGGLSYNEKGQVQSVLQKTEINITAEGVNCNKPVNSDNSKKDPQFDVKLDRPFVFFIIDNESNIPLFAGIVSNI